MRGWNRFRGVRALLAGLALALACPLFGEAQPEWEFEVLESKKAAFEVPQLHDKDGAWLLTFRMRVKSLKLVPPVSRIELEGLVVSDEPVAEGEEEPEPEVVWTKSHTIRRRDFEAAYGGGRSQFVRIFLKDVPPEVTRVRMSYLKEEGAE